MKLIKFLPLLLFDAGNHQMDINTAFLTSHIYYLGFETDKDSQINKLINSRCQLLASGYWQNRHWNFIGLLFEAFFARGR